MNIQEFEAIVKQTLGLEGVAKQTSVGDSTWFDLVQEDGNAVVDVTYYLGSKWTIEITLKLGKDDVKIIKNHHWILSPDLEEGEYLSVYLYGEGQTLAEAVSDALF